MRILKVIITDILQYDLKKYRIKQFEMWRSNLMTEIYIASKAKTPHEYNNLTLIKNLLDQTTIDNVDPYPYLLSLSYALDSQDTD